MQQSLDFVQVMVSCLALRFRANNGRPARVSIINLDETESGHRRDAGQSGQLRPHMSYRLRYTGGLAQPSHPGGAEVCTAIFSVEEETYDSIDQ
jgi:hypothetical protein